MILWEKQPFPLRFFPFRALPRHHSLLEFFWYIYNPSAENSNQFSPFQILKEVYRQRFHSFQERQLCKYQYPQNCLKEKNTI